MPNTLPQNYQLGNATLLEDFSDFTKWNAEKINMTVTTDTTNVKVSSQSIKIRPTVGNSSCTIDKTFTTPVDISGNGHYVIRFFVDAQQGLNGVIPNLSGSMTVYLSSTVNYSKYQNHAISFLSLRPGWNYYPLFADRRNNLVGGETLESFQRMRISINTSTMAVSACPDITLDGVYYNVKPLPLKLVLTFDDGWRTVYDNAFQYMRDRGIRATMYTIPNFLRDSGLPGSDPVYMSKSEIKALHGAGWCIANHTIDHTFYRTNVSNTTDYKDKVKQCIDWLLANGYTKGAYHIAYPKGEYDSGVLQTVTDFGMKTGRGVTDYYLSTMEESIYEIPTRAFHSGYNIAQAKTIIDWSIGKGGTQFLMFHQIPLDDTINNGADSNPSIAFSQAKMMALIDYIVERKIECITVDEWYEGLKNPRYPHTPLARG